PAPPVAWPAAVPGCARLRHAARARSRWWPIEAARASDGMSCGFCARSRRIDRVFWPHDRASRRRSTDRRCRDFYRAVAGWIRYRARNVETGPAVGDLVIHNARVMTCDPARLGVGMIDHGAIALSGAAIRWVGSDAERPHAEREIDAGGRLITPGLIDCHTHAIFAGERANEFGMRAAGKSYLEIARAGGGIAASLGPTRAASDAQLIAALGARLDAALAGGTTAIEVKSGYDLTVEG